MRCNWKQELCVTETCQNRFLDTVIGDAKVRPSFAIYWVAQDIWFCTLTYFFIQNYLQQLFYRKIYWNLFSDFYFNCLIHFFEWKFRLANLSKEKLGRKNLLLFLENEVFYLKKINPIFPIKLGQRLPKSFFLRHIKNSRVFLSYFLKTDEWPKACAGPKLPNSLLYYFKFYAIMKLMVKKTRKVTFISCSYFLCILCHCSLHNWNFKNFTYNFVFLRF